MNLYERDIVIMPEHRKENIFHFSIENLEDMHPIG